MSLMVKECSQSRHPHFKTENCKYNFKPLSNETLTELNGLNDPSREEITNLREFYIDDIAEKKVYDTFIDRKYSDNYFSDDEAEVAWEKFISTKEYRNEYDNVKKEVKDKFSYPNLKSFSDLFPVYAPELHNKDDIILRYCASFYTIPEKALKSGMIIGVSDFDDRLSLEGFGSRTGLPYGYWYYIRKVDEYTFNFRKIELDYSSHLSYNKYLSGCKMSIHQFRSPLDFCQYYDDELIWIEAEKAPLVSLEDDFSEVDSAADYLEELERWEHDNLGDGEDTESDSD